MQILEKGEKVSEFDKKEYDYKFKRENYEQLRMDIPKGNKRLLKEYAEANGLSMADLIVAAVKRQYGIDLREKHPGGKDAAESDPEQKD